ncbi:MAG: hypothetical protein ABGX47_13680 [Martelella sp.]
MSAFATAKALDGAIDGQAVGHVCDLFTEEECNSFFNAAGYETD